MASVYSADAANDCGASSRRRPQPGLGRITDGDFAGRTSGIPMTSVRWRHNRTREWERPGSGSSLRPRGRSGRQRSTSTAGCFARLRRSRVLLRWSDVGRHEQDRRRGVRAGRPGPCGRGPCSGRSGGGSGPGPPGCPAGVRPRPARQPQRPAGPRQAAARQDAQRPQRVQQALHGGRGLPSTGPRTGSADRPRPSWRGPGRSWPPRRREDAAMAAKLKQAQADLAAAQGRGPGRPGRARRAARQPAGRDDPRPVPAADQPAAAGGVG